MCGRVTVVARQLLLCRRQLSFGGGVDLRILRVEIPQRLQQNGGSRHVAKPFVICGDHMPGTQRCWCG